VRPPVATVALMVFAFVPMTREMATSGHPIQISLAFLFAAAICPFWQTSEWRVVLATALALALLTIGLTRAEIFLAFPWLVLAQADMRSISGFLRSCAIRSIVPMAVLALTFALSTLLVSPLGTRSRCRSAARVDAHGRHE
jgi:hypothetical protein